VFKVLILVLCMSNNTILCKIALDFCNNYFLNCYSFTTSFDKYLLPFKFFEDINEVLDTFFNVSVCTNLHDLMSNFFSSFNFDFDFLSLCFFIVV